MNKIYRLVWSGVRGSFVAAPETARGHGKAGGASVTVAAAASVCLFGLPGLVLAQSVVVAPGSGNTKAYAAGNGATVVNIDTANSAGLSHNKYSTYNVDAKGLVLNNGDTSMAERQSILAGRVGANTNLAAPARVILNEVVTANRSTLAGFTEVLGAKADVIVANPYGITCNGCGFINTDRVTLGTGAPNFGVDGSFAGFAVNRGDILITGSGLNATAQQILDLVTRSVKVDAPINGPTSGALGITTGLNQWSYDSRSVTGNTTAGDAAPGYAIDSSALGGMYVGRITLTATEAGVGVRMLGEAAASASDFTLTSAGKIEIGSSISAASAASVATSSASGTEDLFLNGAGASISSGTGKLALSSAGETKLMNGKLFAGTDLSVSSASLSDTGAQTDTRFAKGNSTITTTGAASIDGTAWGADGALKGQFDSLSIGTGGATLYAGATLDLTAAGDLALGAASIKSSGDMVLGASTGAITTTAGTSQGIETTAGNLTLTAGNGLDNAGFANADAGSITVRTDGTLTNSGKLQAKTALDIADKSGAGSGNISNSGTLLADGSLSVRADTITNQATGIVQGGTGSTLDADSLTNEGAVTASTAPGQSSSITLASVTNRGTLQSNGDLSLNVSSSLSNTGIVAVDHDLTITGSGASFDTQSGMVSGKAVSITVASLNNSGTLQSDADMTLTIANALTNGDTLHAGTTLSSSSASLTNNGTLQATQGGTISVTGTLVNTGNLYVSDTAGYDATVNAATLTNSGTLQSKGGATLNLATELDNRNQLMTAGALTVRGTDAVYTVNNTNLMQSGGLMDIKGQGGGNGVAITVGNTGVMHGDSMSVNAGAISVGDGGKITSDGNMDMTAATLSFGGSGSKIVAASSGSGDATITVASAFSNPGAVHSGHNMTFNAPSITNTANGAFSALDTLMLNASGGNLSNAGALYAGKNLVASATGTFTNDNTIDSDDAMTLSASSFKNSAQINAKGNLTISAATFNNETPDDITRITNVTASSGPAVDDMSATPDSVDYWYSFPDDYRREYFSRTWTTTESFKFGAPTHKPQIISAGTLTIKDFTQANNTGGILSGADAVNLIGSNFVMDSLDLETKNYKQTWQRFTHWMGLRGAPVGYYDNRVLQNLSGDILTGGSSAHGANAGIYGAHIGGNIGGLALRGSTYGPAATTPRSATGTSSTPLTSGIAGTNVNGQPAVQFTFVTITLPTSPNGYFVLTKDPAAKYLVETNPLFQVGASYNGSEYLQSQLTGNNPAVILKHLGDASYEAYLVREQLIADTGRNLLVTGESEQDMLKRLYGNAASDWSAAGLSYGTALSQSQQDALARDIVWMVSTKVAGQDVLVPVVYLSKATRNEIESGAVIAGNAIDLNVGSLTNTGGTIAGKDSLKITAEKDIDNISGTIKGGAVTLTSTTGSINNRTFAQSDGVVLHDRNGNPVTEKVAKLDKYGQPMPELDSNGQPKLDASGQVVYQLVEQPVYETFNTVIGKTAGITSTGSLTLDAKKGDISNKGAQVNAGGGAVLNAGGDIVFDTIENRTTTSKGFTPERDANELLAGASGRSRTTTKTQTQSGLTVNGGDLAVTAGNDIALIGTKVNVAEGDATLTATAGDLKVLARQDSTQTHTESVIEGLGVGGGIWGKKTTVTDDFDGVNVGSSITVGGKDGKGNLNLSAVNKDITIQGSDIQASGSGDMQAKNVNILEGHDEHTKSKTVTTDAFLVINAPANVAASDRIDVGRDLKPVTVEDKKRMYLGDINRPTQYDANGNVVAYGNEGDLKNNPPHDGSIYGQFDQVGANTVGNRKGFKTYDEAVGQTDHVEAPGLTLYQNTVQTDSSTKKTSVAPKLSFGKNLNIKGSDSVTLVGANVDAKDIVLESKAVNIMAGTSTDETTSSTTVNQLGLYVSADAAGKAGTSTEYMTQDQVMGSATGEQAGANASGLATGGASAFGKGMANGGVDVFRNNKDSTTTTTTTKTGSSLTGANVTIRGTEGGKANSLILEGTKIEAAKDVTLQADTVDVLAAGTKTVTQTDTERHRVGLNINISADANASAEGSASGDASAHASPLGVGATAGFSAEGSANAQVNLEARVELARGKVINKTQTDTTVAGSTIHAGNQLKVDAGTLNVKGSELSGDNKVDVAAKEMNFMAAEEVHDTTSTSTKYSVGRYAEANLSVGVSASASGRASVEGAGTSANANNGTGPADYAKRVGMAEASASAGASAEVSARASTGYYGTGTQLTQTTTDHRAKVSSITSRDGDIVRTGVGSGSAISDVGTKIEAAGDFAQNADTISSRAASDYKASSLDEVNATVKVGNYISAVAKTRVDADASIDRNQGFRKDFNTKEDPLSGDVAPAQYNRMDTPPDQQSRLPGFNPTKGDPLKEVPTANVKAAVAVGVEMGAEVNNESNKYTYQTAVASTIKAGRISSTSKGNTTMEGTRLDATATTGDGVVISAGSLDMEAATNKETGTKTTNAVAAKMWAGAALGTSGAKDFGLTGNFDQVADTDSRTREMAGQITTAGGSAVKITTSGDARFVGTKIDAGGDTALNVGGKLDMLAAKDERTKTNNTAKVAANITDNQAACQGPQAQSRSCSGLTVGESNENMASSTYTGGSISSGGTLTINAGGAATLQSTNLQAANGIAIDGGDSVQFTNAADTRSTTKGSLDIQLNAMNGQNWRVDKPGGTSMDKENSKKWGSGKIAASQDTRSEAVIGSVNATGGNVSITSKKDLRFEGTGLNAADGSIAVTSTDGSVNFDVAKSTRLAGGIGASAGASTNTIDATTNQADGSAPATRLVRTGNSQALQAYVTATTVESGSAVNAKGGVTVTSKNDLTLKGTKVASTDGDIAVKSTNGNVVAGTADSTMLNFSVDASRINFDTTKGATSQGKNPDYRAPDNIGDRMLAIANKERPTMPQMTAGQAAGKVVGASPSPNRNDWSGQTTTEGNADTRGNGGHGAVGGTLDVRETFDGASFTAKNGTLTIDSAGAQGKTTLVNVQKDVKAENIEKAGGLDTSTVKDIGISAGGKTTWNTHGYIPPKAPTQAAAGAQPGQAPAAPAAHAHAPAANPAAPARTDTRTAEQQNRANLSANAAEQRAAARPAAPAVPAAPVASAAGAAPAARTPSRANPNVPRNPETAKRVAGLENNIATRNAANAASPTSSTARGPSPAVPVAAVPSPVNRNVARNPETAKRVAGLEKNIATRNPAKVAPSSASAKPMTPAQKEAAQLGAQAAAARKAAAKHAPAPAKPRTVAQEDAAKKGAAAAVARANAKKAEDDAAKKAAAKHAPAPAKPRTAAQEEAAKKAVAAADARANAKKAEGDAAKQAAAEHVPAPAKTRTAAQEDAAKKAAAAADARADAKKTEEDAAKQAGAAAAPRPAKKHYDNPWEDPEEEKANN